MTTTISEAVVSTLQSHLDEDTCDYIASLLEEDPCDDDVRETVISLIEGSVADDVDDDASSEHLIQELFRLLDDLNAKTMNDNDKKDKDAVDNNERNSDGITTLRKLDQAVTLKEHDVETFASGLVADHGTDATTGDGTSKIADFYANMIDISGNEAAKSERARRKQRQKELRERMEEEERQRAIQDAMSMFEINKKTDDENWAKDDNATDVHLKGFDLPNLRGGGPNLLNNASLTLAKGRRYGLMGRNGCGKTTLMTFCAKRQVEGIPRNMNMLLVRQEIMGNEWTSVETVLKSDVKRESVKRFITWCESELEKLERGNDDDDVADGASSKSSKAANNKSGRQKLRDRKKQSMQKAARLKVEKEAKRTKEESREAKKASLTDQLRAAYERLGQIESEYGDPEPLARKVLSGLGFTTEMQDKPTQELSGGWRMRVSLSCALFANPSLLLLDEPTNHLDLEAVLWLERYLTTQFQGTLLVVSHDRHFLNEIVTDVVHFHRNQLKTYRGDITNFETVRADDRQRQIRQREIQENKRAHLQKYIDLHAQAGENGVKAARQRKSKMKKLDKLGVMAQDGKRWKSSYDGDADEVEEFVEDEQVELRFPDPGAFDGDIIRLEQVKFGYGDNNNNNTQDKLLLSGLDLSINSKSRIALLGRNGCGKSTLIKLAVGALRATGGRVVIDGRAKMEYLAQHQLEQLDPDGTPMTTMIDRYPGDGSNTHIGSLRRYLANFGLGGDVLPAQKIHTMSGGQKCRLCLACAMYRKPHLLILDEPTNHLDLETTEALIEAIQSFQGGVLLVSHDQHLLTSVCKQMYVVENGKLQLLRHGMSNNDAFTAYKKAVVAGRR